MEALHEHARAAEELGCLCRREAGLERAVDEGFVAADGVVDGGHRAAQGRGRSGGRADGRVRGEQCAKIRRENAERFHSVMMSGLVEEVGGRGRRLCLFTR